MYNESTIYEYYESIMYTLIVLIRLTSLFGRLGRRALREAAAVVAQLSGEMSGAGSASLIRAALKKMAPKT